MAQPAWSKLLTKEFLAAIATYRAVDDVALPIADQFQMIADRIREDRAQSRLKER